MNVSGISHHTASKALLMNLFAFVIVSVNIFLVVDGSEPARHVLRWTTKIGLVVALGSAVLSIAAVFIEKSKGRAVLSIIVSYFMFASALSLITGEPKVIRKEPPIIINPDSK